MTVLATGPSEVMLTAAAASVGLDSVEWCREDALDLTLDDSSAACVSSLSTAERELGRVGAYGGRGTGATARTGQDRAALQTPGSETAHPARRNPGNRISGPSSDDTRGPRGSTLSCSTDGDHASDDQGRSPRVSVIMAAHNASRFLDEALDGILAQSFSDLELIVVDDGSTDATPSLLEKHANPRLRVVHLPQNRGPSAARNSGLAIAKGEYSAWADSDDVSQPERLAQQVAFLDQHPEVQVLGSQLSIIDEAGRHVGYRAYPLSHEGIVEQMKRTNAIANPSVMFRTRVVVDAGAFREDWLAAEDYELWSRLARDGVRFANHAEPLIKYRVHAHAAKSTTLHAQIRASLEIKRIYWCDQLGCKGHVRMALEHLLLLLPTRLVLALFIRVTYDRELRVPRQ